MARPPPTPHRSLLRPPPLGQRDIVPLPPMDPTRSSEAGLPPTRPPLPVATLNDLPDGVLESIIWATLYDTVPSISRWTPCPCAQRLDGWLAVADDECAHCPNGPRMLILDKLCEAILLGGTCRRLREAVQTVLSHPTVVIGVKFPPVRPLPPTLLAARPARVHLVCAGQFPEQPVFLAAGTVGDVDAQTAAAIAAATRCLEWVVELLGCCVGSGGASVVGRDGSRGGGDRGNGGTSGDGAFPPPRGLRMLCLQDDSLSWLQPELYNGTRRLAVAGASGEPRNPIDWVLRRLCHTHGGRAVLAGLTSLRMPGWYSVCAPSSVGPDFDLQTMMRRATAGGGGGSNSSGRGRAGGPTKVRGSLLTMAMSEPPWLWGLATLPQLSLDVSIPPRRPLDGCPFFSPSQRRRWRSSRCRLTCAGAVKTRCRPRLRWPPRWRRCLP